MTQFQHSPLPPCTPDSHYIRLLDLLPSPSKTSQLVVRLRTVRIEDNPSYECLSYAWGPGGLDHTLLITSSAEDPSDEASRPFPIRKSLHDALTTLRHHYNAIQKDQEVPRTLWADAVCINQSDIAERNAQVALMGVIYWSASHVAIWLGPDPSGRHAAAAFATMAPIAAAHWRYDGSIPHYTTQEELNSLPAGSWNAVAAFYTAIPWFRRAWVQQELGLARAASFYWGADHRPPVDVRDVFGFDIWLEHVGENVRSRFIPGDVSGVRGTRNTWLQYGQVTRPGWLPDDEAVERHLRGNPFLVVLLDGSHCAASDPRDHVFAFLGHPSARRDRERGGYKGRGYREMMLSEGSGDGLIIRADYAKSVQEVYGELARQLLAQHGDLRMLGAVCHTEESITSGTSRGGEYPSWVPRWDIIKGENIIGVSGWGWPNRIEYSDGTGHSIGFRSYFRIERGRLTAEGMIFWTVTEVLEWTGEKYQDAKEKIMGRERSIPIYTELVVRRRVFKTHDGQEGLVQDIVREGDVVALLVGAYTPCVLRRVDGGRDGEFVLVGTCVMFGMSDGRLNEMVREGHGAGRLQDIVLV